MARHIALIPDKTQTKVAKTNDIWGLLSKYEAIAGLMIPLRKEPILANETNKDSDNERYGVDRSQKAANLD